MRTLYFRPVVSFFFLSFFLLPFSFFLPLISAVADWMSTVLLHMMWPQCEFRMRVWNVRNVSFWKYRTQKIVKRSPSGHHRTTLSGYIFTTKACINSWKKLVKQQYLLHMSPRYGKLRLINGWDPFGSLGHLSKFQWVFASWLHYSSDVRSPEANKTLYDLWLSPGLVHYIYIFGGFCPLRNFASCKIYFASKSCILLYW